MRFLKEWRQSLEHSNVSNINYDPYDDSDDEREVRDHETCERGASDARKDLEWSDFFASGRDFESTSVNHRYTQKEKEVLNSYESLDYLPTDSVVYRRWLRQQPVRNDWDRWLMMGLIGVSVGLIGFLLHQLIDLIANCKWKYARELIQSDLALAWLWIFGYSLVFLLPASALVVFFRPSAAGSGMPELIGFLNGTLIRHIFNIKTLVVKFVSCAFAVGSGMPVGPEGPMIHIGALVGAGVSQLQSKTLGFTLPFFHRLRNSQDRRNFISAGAAAGIASAFGAPVGGLLFAMEEVSSYWTMRLSWQTFFCCMVSAFTTDLLDSSFSAFRYEGQFGQFKTDRYIMFNVESGIDMNILALIPCIFLGILGGALGSGFTFFNLKIVKLRRTIQSKLKSERSRNVVKLLEPVLILFITTGFTILVPEWYSCTPFTCVLSAEDSVCTNSTNSDIDVTFEANVEYFNCPYNEYDLGNGSTYINGSYSQAATLFFGSGESAIHHLFSRNTHHQFDYYPLVVMLVFYYTMSCWAAGTYISSGLVVPMLLIGGLYGRMIGKLMVDAFGVQTEEYWDWIDPGAMALIGAVSFFGGVTRLTMSLTVIMVEMTNDIQFLLLFMVTVMVAKWIGDFVTHPIYHALLEVKGIPFLEQDARVTTPEGDSLNLDLFSASHVMNSPVMTLKKVDKISTVAKLLLSSTHGGFPIVNDSGVFAGLMTRLELTLLLIRFQAKRFSLNDEVIHKPSVSFEEVSAFMNRRVKEPAKMREALQEFSALDDVLIDVSDYVNASAVSLSASFSLQRTYLIFRSLGLRHLTIVDPDNKVVGIVTRKDLMGFALEDKLLSLPLDVPDTNLDIASSSC